MAQYKVPQNVESEDKILGPLSLRQFIYVVIALMWGFLMWRIFWGISPAIAILLILPISGPLVAIGIIQREEQSFENYFIAMIRYILVPRKRVWLKDDIKEVFKEPPKKPKAPELHRNPEEVRGQLKKLAMIVDTRGRVKNPNIQLPDANNQAEALGKRVNIPEEVAKEILEAHINPDDDILDLEANQKAVTVGQLLENVEADIRAEALNKMQKAINTPHPAKPSGQTQAPPTAAPPSNSITSNDILNMAVQNDALTVAQVASQANKYGNLTEGQTAELRQS